MPALAERSTGLEILPEYNTHEIPPLREQKRTSRRKAVVVSTITACALVAAVVVGNTGGGQSDMHPNPAVTSELYPSDDVSSSPFTARGGDTPPPSPEPPRRPTDYPTDIDYPF